MIIPYLSIIPGKNCTHKKKSENNDKNGNFFRILGLLFSFFFANFFRLSALTVDVERSSVIVEALSAESKRYVVPAYYDISLSIKDVRDEESKEMLDILFAGRVYDIGYMYDSGIYWLMGNLLKEKKTNFASEYEKAEAAYQKYYDKIAEQYRSAVE
jgi:hypothetical protein